MEQPIETSGIKPSAQDIEKYDLGEYEQSHMSAPVEVYLHEKTYLDGERMLREMTKQYNPSSDLPGLEHIAARFENGIPELAKTPDGYHVIACRVPVLGVIYLRPTRHNVNSPYNATVLAFIPAGIPVKNSARETWDERKRIAFEYIRRLVDAIIQLVWRNDDLEMQKRQMGMYRADGTAVHVAQPASSVDGHLQQQEQSNAADDFVRRLIPAANAIMKPGNAPMWYGWALRDGFLAGIDWQQRKSQASQPAEPTLSTQEGGEDGATLLDAILYASKHAYTDFNINSHPWDLLPIAQADQRALAIHPYELPERGMVMYLVDGLTLGGLAAVHQRLSEKALIEAGEMDRFAKIDGVPTAFYWKNTVLVDTHASLTYLSIGTREPTAWTYVRNMFSQSIPEDRKAGITPDQFPILLVAHKDCSIEKLRESVARLLA